MKAASGVRTKTKPIIVQDRSMRLFEEKAVGAASTLGERFRRLREEMRLTLDEVAQRTGVQAKHLAALEEGRYGDLPGPVYAKNFVKRYAELLEIRVESAFAIFEREYSVAAQLTPPPAPPSKSVEVREILSPQKIRWALILLLTLGVLVYLGMELRNLTSAPTIVIEFPPEELTTSDHTMELVGKTEPETIVTANGKLILVDRNGDFRELLDLQDGLNTIAIRGKKKRGVATTIIRKILVTSQ